MGAAAAGASRPSRAPSTKALDGWIAALNEREKVALLSRVARGEVGVGGELMGQFRRWQAPWPSVGRLRTAGALLALARQRAEHRRSAAITRETKARAVRQRAQATAREKHLAKLAKRQTHAWLRVEALIVTKRPADYDAAVILLRDLRELGARARRSADFAKGIRALRKAHAKKPSLLARLKKAGL